MASENEKCGEPSHVEVGDACRLATLRKRSQLDFEIDFFERILSRDPNYVEVLMNLGDLFTQKGCRRRALQVDLRLSQLRPNSAMVSYNLACSHALLKHTSDALEALRRAVELGYADLDHMLADPDLASLRPHPEFQRLVANLSGNANAARVV